VDFNARLKKLENMLRRLIREDIELATRFDPSLRPVFADPLQLAQAVTDLVVNARDTMPGGGRLTLDTANVLLNEAFFDRIFLPAAEGSATAADEDKPPAEGLDGKENVGWLAPVEHCLTGNDGRLAPSQQACPR
jgi:hypothetical protein